MPEEDLPVVLPTDVTLDGVRSPLVDLPEFLNVTFPGGGPARRRPIPSIRLWSHLGTSRDLPLLCRCDGRMNGPNIGPGRSLCRRYRARHTAFVVRAVLLQVDARRGLVIGDEPFKRLMMLGMVLQGGKKMSKSAGDAGDPQKLLDRYGADAVRWP